MVSFGKAFSILKLNWTKYFVTYWQTTRSSSLDLGHSAVFAKGSPGVSAVPATSPLTLLQVFYAAAFRHAAPPILEHHLSLLIYPLFNYLIKKAVGL